MGNDVQAGGMIPAAVSAVVSSAATSTFNGYWNGFQFGAIGDRPLLIQLTPGTPKLPVVFRPRLDGFAEWHIQQGGYSDYSPLLDKIVYWGLANDKPRIVIWTDGKEHLAVCQGTTVLVNVNNDSWTPSNTVTYGSCLP